MGDEPSSAQATGGMMAKAGKIATGTAANIAQGSWDVAKAKTGKMIEGFKEQSRETVGGKIASAIAAAADDQNPRFDADSLGAGKGDSASISEVAAFVGRASGKNDEDANEAPLQASDVKTATAMTKSVFE